MRMTDRPSAAELETARRTLRAAIPDAAAVLVALLKHQDPRTRLRAAEAILNRAGVTEATAVHATTAEHRVGGEPDSLDPLELLRSMGG